MLVPSGIAQYAELELLFLFLYLFLRLQQDLRDQWEGLVDSHLSEVSLLDLVSGQLLASAGSAPVVLEAGAGRLYHVETHAFQVVVSCHDEGSAEGSEAGIDSAHLSSEG